MPNAKNTSILTGDGMRRVVRSLPLNFLDTIWAVLSFIEQPYAHI
ncbi:hypothetical protein APHMUC_1093 [Anaplasma phagocytophilum str. ApMUC09]|uniref:Uncharacterized protein n=1 Tax=Anaplasma phagocytophilum str. ApMUC09 TaxID=1359152 RepID=A0A0F3NBB2_ANAPH|nr:hypothetical protein APHMUC_1093 [Anaplasma phagocytophilum str. ApMUC09]SCV64310.1 hypothetical protein ANAPH2_00913 [Anaplasma phagocytophilum]SCV65562.1 hypothetical protein ANAPH2_01303 [Anaplasma phagocytophilum]